MKTNEAPVMVDARGLEPLQPLVIILEALERLPEGAELRARTDRRPLHLYALETRLANCLIKRCPDPVSRKPARFDLPMTKRVLAAELGTVSETFSRTLAKFREQKLVAATGKTITCSIPPGSPRFCAATGANSGRAQQRGPLCFDPRAVHHSTLPLTQGGV